MKPTQNRLLAALALAACCGCASQGIRFPAPSQRVRVEADGLSAFAREGWSLPLEVRVYFSNADDGAELAPAQLAAEERAALAQLEAAQRAYALSPFDLFRLEVEVAEGEPRAKLDDDSLTLAVRVPPASGDAPPRVVSAEGLLDVWGASYDWKHDLAWYRDQPEALLREALKRDCAKLCELDEALGLDCRRLELLAASVRARAAALGKDVVLTPSEVEFARAAQFRATYALYRVLNTLGRWRLAGEDEGFDLQPAVLTLLVYARCLEEAYLGWVLETVVGGRSTVRVWTHGWWHRNPLYKVLDGEAQLVALTPGEEPGRLPAGSIRALLELRVDDELGDWFAELDQVWEAQARGGSADDALGADLVAALQPVYDRIAAARERAGSRRWSGFRAWKELWDARLKNGFKFPFYSAIKSLAEFLGDTRVTHPAPAVDAAQLAALDAKLAPGDVILVRQDHYLSNAFLPGFWPHAILYLGDAEAWTALRLSDGTPLADDPLVQRLLPSYRAALPGGEVPRVLEAISEGVLFNSLEHAVQKDYVVAFRPRLSEAERAEAIRRALALHGRPYDFDFDFATDASIVCTELVYRAYNGQLALRIAIDALEDSPAEKVPGVLEVMGRETLPANELARYALYMHDNAAPDPALGYPGQVLDLIGLYDREGRGPAEWLEGDAAWARLAETVTR
ncbi:MAG: hypothetical protein KDD82_26430 [Planctomycetes bacterium]|nr:hypothetical protein [Planctomycetota bacterium]